MVIRAARRNAFYKSMGAVLAPKEDQDGQMKAALDVINSLDELNLDSTLVRFFQACQSRPWMLDVFQLIRDRRKKTKYEQRETRSVRTKGYEDPAAEFFNIVKRNATDEA